MNTIYLFFILIGIGIMVITLMLFAVSYPEKPKVYTFPQTPADFPYDRR